MNDKYKLATRDEIEDAAGFANFGGRSPRYMIEEGLLKAVMGYRCGSTVEGMMHDLNLIRKPERYLNLTPKGRDYLRAMFFGRSVEQVVEFLEKGLNAQMVDKMRRGDGDG